MSLQTAKDFWSTLRTSRLLAPEQVARLESAPVESAPACAETLVEQQILTPFQAEKILAGQGEGLVLGQYRILDRLGAGGMGTVYRAEHILMKRMVALKVIAAVPSAADSANGAAHPATSGSIHLDDAYFGDDAIERFHQEVQAAAQLSHPNIVTAHDAAAAGDVHFLVMEYVDGVDLAHVVKKTGPLALPLACECIRQAALGLQYAYEHGLVHRDIKPANLLLRREWLPPAGRTGFPTPTAIVKILDLGLARFSRSLRRMDADADASHGAGLVGTPDFIAPEIAQDSESADIRSDLYSLGCTFYFLVTGQPPFPGGTWTEKVLRHQLDAAIPVQQLQVEIPDEVAAIVQQMMAKDPSERFPSPIVAAFQLQQWLLTHSRQVTQHNTDTPLPTDSLTWSGVGLAGGHSDGIDQGESAVAPDSNDSALSVKAAPKRRRHFSWPRAILTAIGAGLIIAWLAHPPGLLNFWNKSSRTEPNATPRFEIEGQTEQYVQLADALAAAKAGDVIILHGSGSISVEPLTLNGKTLTLRAADGSRPRLRLAPDSQRSSWQPLMTANADLALEGVDLFCAQDGLMAATSPAHLILCDHSCLRLVRCRLEVERGSAAVVCRHSPHIELIDCTLLADGLGLCLEVGDGPQTTVQLRGNTITMKDTTAAAVSIWGADSAKVTQVDVHLEHNQIDSGRAVALAGLTGGLTIDAVDNFFVFRQSLLSFSGVPAGSNWRQTAAWRGENNIYLSSGEWLHVNGIPQGIRELQSWRILWNATETGSSASVAPPQ